MYIHENVSLWQPFSLSLSSPVVNQSRGEKRRCTRHIMHMHRIQGRRLNRGKTDEEDDENVEEGGGEKKEQRKRMKRRKE